METSFPPFWKCSHHKHTPYLTLSDVGSTGLVRKSQKLKLRRNSVVRKPRQSRGAYKARSKTGYHTIPRERGYHRERVKFKSLESPYRFFFLSPG